MTKRNAMMKELTDAMRSTGSIATRLSDERGEGGAQGIHYTQMSVFIDDDTKMRLSIYKAKERCPFKDIVLDAVKEYLTKRGY